MRYVLRKKEPVLLAVVLFLICLVVGAITGRLYLFTMREEATKEITKELSVIAYGKVDFGALLKYALVKDMLVYLSILFFSMCIVGRWYYLFRILKRGVLVGFLCGELCGVFGTRGIGLALAYFFPAWLLYIPAYYAVYRMGESIWRAFFRSEELRATIGIYLVYWKRIVLWLGVFVAGGLLEATLGTLFLQLIAGYYV